MARTLDDIYKFFEFIERKERGVFTSYAEKDRLFDASQLEVLEDFWRIYAVEEFVHEALDVFKKTYQFTSAADGTVTLPSDYLHLLPNVITVTGSMMNLVRFVSEDAWPKAIRSQLRPVSTANPIAKTYGNGFNLHPQSTQIGTVTYIRRPNAPVYAYTLGGSANRTVTYNSAGSTQLEWDDVYINKIIAKALGYLGINMSEAEVTAFGFAKDKEQ
jgi:hypothetical protein